MTTGKAPSLPMAAASLISGIVALVILVIPFIGVFASALLGPLAVLLGYLELKKSTQGAKYRYLALGGVFIGIIAIVVLAVFLGTGAYSEYAR